VLETGSLYLRTVGPFYGATGLGLLLYFAGQGAGHVLWPVLGGFVRLTIAALGGWLAVSRLGLGEQGLFVLIAAGTAAFGAINAVAVRLATWAPST
jgi:Na+-driven multidrug efflux pump